MNSTNFIVIYDSNYGNTQIIAEKIADELGDKNKAVKENNVNIKDLENVDLIILGSPIIGWRPTENMQNFLAGLDSKILKNKKGATFDTRINVFFHGDATKKMSNILKKLGTNVIVDPAYFFVKNKDGPIVEGELAKVSEWAKNIKNRC